MATRPEFYLEALRKKAKLTREQVRDGCVARGWQVSQGSIDNWLTGRIYPDGEWERRLAEVINDQLPTAQRVNLPPLFSRGDEEPPTPLRGRDSNPQPSVFKKLAA